MTSLPQRNRNTGQVLLVTTIACVAAFGILSRWIFAPDGIYSFGQIWHYFVSYTDFGFTRRALVGTVLTVTGINSLFLNAYVCAYVIYAVELLLLIALITLYCIRYKPFDDWLGYFVVFFSPALILQSGYVTGSQDLEILILTAVGALYATRLVTLTAISVAGVLVHELMVYVLPFLFLLYSVRRDHGAIFLPRYWPKYGLASVPILIAIMGIIVWGQVDIAKHDYQSIMATNMPIAASGPKGWSGWFEVSSPVDENTEIGLLAIGRLTTNWIYYAIPLLYSLTLAIAIAVYTKHMRCWLRLALVITLLLPLIVVFMAYDIYRWIGLSCNLSLLSILVFRQDRVLDLPRPLLWFLAFFTVFAPFGVGGDMTRPFPLLMAAWDRVFY